MKHIKKISMRVFFGIEIILFGYIYVFGSHGIRNLLIIEQEKIQLNQEITTLQAEVASLSNTIAQWDSHPFYKEKIAREQLQMACKNEEIYYIS